MAQDDDLENDVDSTDASGDLDVAANDAMPPAMTSSMKMPSASPPINPVLQSYLQNKQAMAAAQKQAGDNEMYTGLARAGASLAAGLAHSNAPVDQTPFNAMAATDKAPVTNILDAQKSQAQDLSNQAAVVDATKKFNSTDPNSAESMAVKAQIKKLYPGKYDDATLSKISAADIGDYIMKPLELDEKITEHKDEMASRAADRQALFAGKKQDKQDADHEKYVQHTEDNEKNWRSDPASSRYDMMLSATASGKTLIDKYRGREDEMPLQDIHALVSDRLKAITGAAPTEQEIAAQMPSSLRGTMAHPIDSALGALHPAQSGDFVRNIDQSFQEMEQTAMAGLKHRQETIASSPRLTPEERERLVKIAVPTPSYGGSQHAPPPGGHSLQDLQAEKARRQQQSGASASFAFGGTVQPPGFQHVHQPMQPRVPIQRPMAMPKAPTAQIPIGMKATETPQHFACGGTVHNYQQGGTVPGQPSVPFNSPVNDTVTAKLTPKEEVLPLSVTQSKSPSMAAFLHMKSKGYK